MTPILPPQFYQVSGSDISYDAESYRRYVQMVRNARRDLDELPPKIRRVILPIIQDILGGAIRASREIYLPLIDKEKLKIVESSPNDFHTDLDGLEELSKIFE